MMFSYLVFLLVVISTPTLAGICNRCNCYQDTVICNCNEKFQNLTISREDLVDVPRVKNFTISSCKEVALLTNSFGEAHNLLTVNLKQLENVTIHMEVFSSLKHLMIEDVTNLQLKEKAFWGLGNLEDLIIKRSRLAQIPLHGFYDIKGIKYFLLEDVTIDSVTSEAMHITMAEESSLMLFDNCTIENVEENGMKLLPLREFRMVNSSLHNISSNGFTIASTGDVSLAQNLFVGYNMTSTSIFISTERVDITNNTLEEIPDKFLLNIYASLSVTNNTFLQRNLDISNLDALIPINANTTGNRFSCLCSQKTIMSSLKLTKEMTYFLEHNFCVAPCDVPLLNYPEKCPKSSALEGDVIGAYVCDVRLETTTIPTTSGTTRRSNKALPTRN